MKTKLAQSICKILNINPQKGQRNNQFHKFMFCLYYFGEWWIQFSVQYFVPFLIPTAAQKIMQDVDINKQQKQSSIEHMSSISIPLSVLLTEIKINSYHGQRWLCEVNIFFQMFVIMTGQWAASVIIPGSVVGWLVGPVLATLTLTSWAECRDDLVTPDPCHDGRCLCVMTWSPPSLITWVTCWHDQANYRWLKEESNYIYIRMEEPMYLLY